MVLALNKVCRTYRHIVAQVIETKFIVRTECNIRFISFTPFCRIGLMLVYTIDRYTMELVNRTHPFGVTFRQVVIYRYQMNSTSGKCVQKYRKRCNKCFSFTCTHFRNLTTVKYNTPDKLYIIV